MAPNFKRCQEQILTLVEHYEHGIIHLLTKNDLAEMESSR